MSHPDYVNIGTNEVKVIEEIGEVLQALGKAKRFGMENFHPDRPDQTNRRELIAELNDLIRAAERYLNELNVAAPQADQETGGEG